MQKTLTKRKKIALIALSLAALNPISAADLNLTLAGSSGSINGAFFTTTDPRPSVTAPVDTFLRLSDAANREEGFNATARPVMPNVSTSLVATHDIRLSDVPIVNNPSGATPGSYYEFLLDINQKDSKPRLTLYSLRFYTNPNPLSSAGNLAALTSAAGSVLRWNLDTGSDSKIQLNAAIGNSSPTGDLYTYIPVTAFSGAALTHYLYLYSALGEEPGGIGTYYEANDDNEEWAVRNDCPPSHPVSDHENPLLLLCMGTTALGILRFSRGKTSLFT